MFVYPSIFWQVFASRQAFFLKEQLQPMCKWRMLVRGEHLPMCNHNRATLEAQHKAVISCAHCAETSDTSSSVFLLPAPSLRETWQLWCKFLVPLACVRPAGLLLAEPGQRAPGGRCHDTLGEIRALGKAHHSLGQHFEYGKLPFIALFFFFFFLQQCQTCCGMK